MPPPPENERILQSLLRRFRLTQGFLYTLLFVRDERAARTLETRIREQLEARGSALLSVRPEQPGALQRDVYRAVFGDDSSAEPARGPVWVLANRGSDDPVWIAARRSLLMRLNELRGRLEKEFAQPLVLLLPGNAVEATAGSAPDLWHVKGAVEFIDSERGSSSGTGAPSLVDLPPGDPVVAGIERSPATPTPEERRFERLTGPARRAPEPVDSDPLQEEPALLEGIDAADAALRAGRPEDAWRISEQVLQMARALEGNRPDLARSFTGRALLRKGDAAMALGRIDEARSDLEEALSIQRSLFGQGAETALALRRLSIVLDKLGSIAEMEGRLDNAGTAYLESLDAIRRSIAAGGDDPDAVRVLAVALTKVGDVALAEGRIDAASEAFEESLAIQRKLAVAESTASPASRDLSVALNKVAQVAMMLGALDKARAAFEEGLAIRRGLLATGRDTAAARRDLVVSLNHVGLVAAEQERLEEAHAAFQEALQLARELAEAAGSSPSPHAQRDLSISLDLAGTIAEKLGRTDEALAAFQESLSIRRRLITERETLSGTRDLLVSLGNVGDAELQAGSLERAAAAYAEALKLTERLVAEGGETPGALGDLLIALSKAYRVAVKTGDAAAAQALEAKMRPIIQRLRRLVSTGQERALIDRIEDELSSRSGAA